MAVTDFSGDDVAIYRGLHKDLQRVLDEAKRLVKVMRSNADLDFTLIVGQRSASAQAAAFAKGKSKLKFGAHNTLPARAVDFLPNACVLGSKINWNDIDAFRAVAHLLLLAAHNIGVKLRWGGDWDMDGSEADEKGLRDFDHVELSPWQTYGGVHAVPA